ncbi:MAG: PorT family protein [Flavobacteriales bacterium]|nr:PorT family protein [Flavobacteriales bacterium]
MKKIIIGFILVFLGLSSFSQREFKGGILLGGVTSQISGDGLGGWDKFGYTGGAWVNAPLNEKFGLNISMKYITKGSRTKQDTLTFNSFGFYLNYIDVPVMLTYDMQRKQSKFTISIGPYIGILLKQEMKINGASYDVNPAFRKQDIGGQLGFAWWPTEKLFFELDMATSVVPTRPAPAVVNKNSYYEQGNYNQVLQLLMGIRFGGKAKSE